MIDINTIGVGVETREVVTATRELDRFGKSAETASRKADGLTSNTQKLGKESSFAAAGLGRMSGALAAVAGVVSLARTIDQYTKFNAQLKLATRSQEEYTYALADVNRIASTAQSSLEAVGTLYARLNNALRDVGVSQTQVAKITENVGLALKVSGATAQESASAMLQLSQAFGSGVLRGEEFNAVNEAAPALMRALAESIGVPIGALRELASDGKITGDVLAKAFGDDELLNKFRQQAKEVETIGGAWTNLSNRFVTVIGKINEATGAAKGLIAILRGAEVLLSAFQGGEQGSKLRNFLDSAAASKQKRFDSISTPQLRILSKYDNEAKKQLDARVNQQQKNNFSGLNSAGNIAPNFTAPVVAQDIDKIHKQQEEAARKAEDSQKKYSDAADKIRDAATKKRLGQLELEYTTEANNYNKILEKIEEADDAKAKAYKEQLKRTAILQEKANNNFKEAQDVFKKAEEEKRREFEKTVDGINNTFREGFAQLVNGGKGSWKAFTQSLLTTFKTAVADKIYKLFAEPFIVKIVAGLSGLAVSGAAGASANAVFKDGIMQQADTGIFSSIKDALGNGNNSIIGSIENLGSIIANGNGGLLDSIGGFIGANSSAIADGFGYFGAALQIAQGNVLGGIGAGVGTFFGGPIGGAIGSFIGSALGGLFGGGLPPRVTESRTGVLRDGAFTAYDAADPGKRKLGLASPLDNLNETFAKQLNTFFKAYDINSVISSSALLTQKKVVRARFSYGVDNAGGYGYEEDFGKKGTFEQAFSALVENALGQVTVKAIQVSSLPEGIKKFFDGLTKKEDVTDAINTLIGLKMALGDLPDIFDAVRNAIDTTAYTTTIAQLKAQFEATQNFVNLFYSDTEKFNIFTQQLATQLGMLNEVLPTSRDEYRLLVESINVVDAASRDQYNGLIALAPAMNEYFNLLGQQADGINQVNQALADGLNQNLFSTFADYASARVNLANGLSPAGFMANNLTPQGNADLLQAVRDLREAQANTNIVLEAIAAYTYDTAKTQKQWNNDGLPAERVM